MKKGLQKAARFGHAVSELVGRLGIWPGLLAGGPGLIRGGLHREHQFATGRDFFVPQVVVRQRLAVQADAADVGMLGRQIDAAHRRGFTVRQMQDGFPNKTVADNVSLLSFHYAEQSLPIA